MPQTTHTPLSFLGSPAAAKAGPSPVDRVQALFKLPLMELLFERVDLRATG